jgi:hypothetical protein
MKNEGNPTISKRFDMGAKLPLKKGRIEPTYRFSATGQYSNRGGNLCEQAVKK